MALIRRVSRLFAADLNAVLDQIEEPEIVLRHAIREMEEELARQRQREQWLVTEVETTAARIESLSRQDRDLETKLDVCFANDNESLAKKLIRRRLETAKLAEQAEARRETLSKDLDEIRARLLANGDQLEGMRQKADLLAGDQATASGGRNTEVAAVDDDDVEIAFLREKQARKLP